MHVIPAQFPFSVADGEDVDLSFSDGDIVLTFVDLQEKRVEHRFSEVLAFRWSARPTTETPRDDSTFEVTESSWLLEEVRLEGYAKPEDFVHHVLCFNASKVLEVMPTSHHVIWAAA